MTELPVPFALDRHEDVSDVSGTGYVALGWEFPHLAVVRWLGDTASTVVWRSMGAAMSVHGHDGRTSAARLGNELLSANGYIDATLDLTEAYQAMTGALSLIREGR